MSSRRILALAISQCPIRHRGPPSKRLPRIISEENISKCEVDHIRDELIWQAMIPGGAQHRASVLHSSRMALNGPSRDVMFREVRRRDLMSLFSRHEPAVRQWKPRAIYRHGRTCHLTG